MSSPSPRPVPRRRNRTRQRQRILEWLGQTDSHPTASQIHDALRDEFPRLSPGTVYRNLELLVAEGQVRAIGSKGRASRYDGNTEPHNHFICEACGSISDLDLPAPPSLRRRLERQFQLRADRIEIDFYGLCPACSEHRTVEERRHELDATDTDCH